MISPIQQNVVFKGGKAGKSSEGFTGNKPAIQPQRSVRNDYMAAINNVLKLQQGAKDKFNSTTGNNLDTIA